MPSRKKRGTKKRRKTVKNRTFKALNCAPKNNDELLKFTCYTADSLHKLKAVWNVRHPDSTIDTNDPKGIWDKLRSFMADTCNSEACWLRHQCIKHDVDYSQLLDNFAPKAPNLWRKKPTEWLTSVDIQTVMRQWEKAFKCFEFIGPSPIDYDQHKMFDECVWEELCKFSLKRYKKRGKNKIGVIFNLDPHYKGGSHWVALYVDLKGMRVYYFDSYGEKIPRRIMKFVKTVQEQSQRFGQRYSFEENKRRHQYSESECGMYCLFFITRMLLDVPFSFFQNNKISDKYMKHLRKIYFNHDLKTT